MSEEEYSQKQVQGQRAKEQAQRKYGCPCGKWYLSYPALFTHVKQKHQGKAPGTLIKPKTDKARGRPRLPTNPEEDPSVMNYDCGEEMDRVLFGKDIQYNQLYEQSEGKESCQDMATNFIINFGTDEVKRKFISCFLNYIKFYVEFKYDHMYWTLNKPNDLIDISNDLVRGLESNKKQFPLEKQTLIELLFILFRWMYKNKWTDHKLVKRVSENQKRVK